MVTKQLFFFFCCCCFSNCTFKFKGKRNYVCPEPCPLHYTQSEPFQIFSVFSLQSLFQISPWEDDCSNTEKKTKRNQIFCKQFQELMMSTTITEKINVCFFSHKLRYTHIFTPLVQGLSFIPSQLFQQPLTGIPAKVPN